MSLGMSKQELQEEIERRIARLDEAQEDADQLGQYGELLRMMTMIAYQRAADLITANNRRIEDQLRAAGIEAERVPKEKRYPQRDSNPRSSP